MWAGGCLVLYLNCLRIFYQDCIFTLLFFANPACISNQRLFYFFFYRLDTEKARGVYMTQGTRYYLEAVLYDISNYNEYMALLMKIPGVDDIWRPVTNNYLIKI